MGIAIVAYSPLGRGFLTGAYKSPEDLPEDDFRRHNPRFQGEAFKEVRSIRYIETMRLMSTQEFETRRCAQVRLDVLYARTRLSDLNREIAEKKGCTAGQLTLAWVLAQGEDFFAIPGTKKEK